MTIRPISVPNRAFASPSQPQSVRRRLRLDRPFSVIDLCLAMVAIAMVFTNQLTLLLQVTFLLLMLGSCYWSFPGFVGRSLLWGGVATAELLAAVMTDVAPRSHLLQLIPLSVMLVVVYTLVSRRNIVERTLNYVEQHDNLTRLPNRESFVRRLDEVLASSSRAHRAVAVISLDLDNFETVNATLGHQVADELLVVIGERLRATLRGSDFVARVGADEYLILVGTDPAAVPRIAERIAAAIEMPSFISGHEVKMTASLGIALSVEPSPAERDGLIRSADAAMRRVKSEGKAGYEVFSPLAATG